MSAPAARTHLVAARCLISCAWVRTARMGGCSYSPWATRASESRRQSQTGGASGAQLPPWGPAIAGSTCRDSRSGLSWKQLTDVDCKPKRPYPTGGPSQSMPSRVSLTCRQTTLSGALAREPRGFRLTCERKAHQRIRRRRPRGPHQRSGAPIEQARVGFGAQDVLRNQYCSRAPFRRRRLPFPAAESLPAQPGLPLSSSGV
jgi:hypothetical protein